MDEAVMLFQNAVKKVETYIAQIKENDATIARYKEHLKAAEATNKAVVADKKRIQRWARKMKREYGIEEEIPDDCC